MCGKNFSVCYSYTAAVWKPLAVIFQLVTGDNYRCFITSGYLGQDLLFSQAHFQKLKVMVSGFNIAFH